MLTKIVVLTDPEEAGCGKGLLSHANGTTIQPQFTGIPSKMLSGNAAKNKQRQSIVFPGLQQWEEGRIACIANAVKNTS